MPTHHRSLRPAEFYPVWHGVRRFIRGRFIGQGLDERHQIVELVFLEVAGFAVLILRVEAGEDFEEGLRMPMMQVRRAAVDASSVGVSYFGPIFSSAPWPVPTSCRLNGFFRQLSV